MVQLIGSSQTLPQLVAGFDQLAALLALTLGPTQGNVLSGGRRVPTEILSDAGVIARRVVELNNPAENVGAMLLREMATRVREDYGDGVATAVVLARAILHEASRMVAAGENPMQLRSWIECGIAIAIKALEAQAVPLAGRKMLAQWIEQVTGDTELSSILGEIFDILGANGAVEIEEYQVPTLDHDYLAGGRWYARPAARVFLPESKSELILENPVVVLVDQKLERVHQVRAMLEHLVGALDRAPLLLIAPEITGEALQTLTMNHTRGVLTVAAVVMKGLKTPLTEELKDIAALTGSDVLSSASSSPPERVHISQFGRAQRVILQCDTLTIIGGKGSQQAKQTRINTLRGQLRSLKPTDEAHDQLKKRIARLSGGIAVLKIGAYSDRERAQKKETAQKAIRIVEAALAEGVVSGGGIAYLNCIPALLNARHECSDKSPELNLVAKALEAPFLQLVANQGIEAPRFALHTVRQLGACYGFDVRTGDYVCMSEVGVMDSLHMLRGALQAAASAAIMAITTDVMVLHGASR
jgi:chaperonin GroEL